MTFLHPRYWFTWIGLGMLRLVSALPWSIVAALSNGLGILLYHLSGSRKEIARKNLRTCFPDWSNDQVEKVVRKSFKLSGQAALLTGLAWWAPKKRFRSLVECDASLVDEYRAQGKNIILLTPHFLGLEAAGVYLSMDRPITNIYQYTKNALIHHFVREKRSRFGAQLVERKEPLRRMLKLIKGGTPLYYLPDQDAGRKGRFVPFFGVQASTFDLLGKMVRMTDSVVIPCSAEIRESGKGLRISFQEPLKNFPTGDDDLDTETMNKVMEAMIQNMRLFT